MLYIGKPYLERGMERVSLCAQVTICGKTEKAWFSVERKYASYLTVDRADAFLIGFLTTAMCLGEDICCEAPITKRLNYQISTYLIPVMADNMERYRAINIYAPVTEEVLPSEEAVGTGWTGGVDSMYTLMTHQSSLQSDYPLTHLLCANVGTLESDHNEELLKYMVEKARAGIAGEQGLEVIGVDSNLHLLQDEPYLAVAAFRLPAAVLALQKLFRVFLHSGAYEFSRFSFVEENSAYYELLPLECFETENTVFYSAGSQVTRIQKLKELSDYVPARKYLHPCIYIQRNNCGKCGKCGKCIRTMGALYALETLDHFREVFDVDDFYQNQNDYISQILAKKESQHYGEVIALMKERGMELSPDIYRKARILRTAAMVAKKRIYTKE